MVSASISSPIVGVATKKSGSPSRLVLPGLRLCGGKSGESPWFLCLPSPIRLQLHPVHLPGKPSVYCRHLSRRPLPAEIIQSLGEAALCPQEKEGWSVSHCSVKAGSVDSAE